VFVDLKYVLSFPGPVTSRDIRSRHRAGELHEYTYVWREGMADWITLRHALGNPEAAVREVRIQ